MNIKEETLRIQKQALDLSPLTYVFPPSPYYRFLYLLAKQFKLKVMIELGVNSGGGSYHLATGNKDGLVYGVDTDNAYPDKVKHVTTHCINFQFILGDSISFANSPILGQKEIDLIFFDTLHNKRHVLKEIGAYKPKMSKNCFLVFDDLNRPEFGNFWEIIPYSKVRLDPLHEEGFGIAWLT